MAIPQLVVVDTGDQTLTLDRDPDGNLLDPDTANRYAQRLNDSRKPGYRTWRPFRLVPTAAQYLVEEFVQVAEGRELVNRRFLVAALSPRAAFTAASGQGEAAGQGRFLFAAGELEVIEEDWRWAASDGSGICYEVRRMPGLTVA